MRTVSVRLIDLNRVRINLGFVGENEHTRVIIDCKKAFDEYPSAVPSLAVENPRGESYPAFTTVDGNFVYWDVLDSDLVADGDGKIQLSFVVGEVTARSYIGHTVIGKSILANGEIPSPVETWIEQANAILAEIPQTIDDALEEAKESGEFKGDPGEPGADGHTPVIDGSKSGKTTTITADGVAIAQIVDGEDGQPGDPGQPGADGFSPAATVTKSGKVATITITDKNGTTTETVSDGEDADPTTLIDDSSTAANKVWSAQKSNDLKSEINAKYTKPSTGIPASDLASGVIPVPSVTAADNGKILMVVNGEWSAATIGTAEGGSF